MLKLIAEAHTNKQIAEILHLAEKTVESHRANLLRKLGMRDRVELVRYAIRRGPDGSLSLRCVLPSRVVLALTTLCVCASARRVGVWLAHARRRGAGGRPAGRARCGRPARGCRTSRCATRTARP